MPTVTAVGSLLHDHHGELRPDFGMQLDAHAELPQRPDRLGQIDLALVHVNALLLETPLDVAGGHRAVELVFLPDLHGEGEADPCQFRRFSLGRLFLGLGQAGEPVGLEGDPLAIPFGGGVGQAFGQEVVAGVAVFDLDDLTRPPEVLDVQAQDDLHRRFLFIERWAGRTGVAGRPARYRTPRASTGSGRAPATAAATRTPRLRPRRGSTWAGRRRRPGPRGSPRRAADRARRGSDPRSTPRP